MTNFESSQPDVVFISAGRLAFMGYFPMYGNPYRNSDKYKLWKRGWQKAEFQAGGKKTPRIVKSYFEPELEVVECVWCGDEYFEGEKCIKCT